MTPETEDLPPPPSLHWLLLLLLDVATIGVFLLIWCFVQARWARKVRGSNAAYWYAASFMLAIPITAIKLSYQAAPVDQTVGTIYGLMYIGANVLYQMGTFSIKHAVELAYDSTGEGRRLNGLITICFSQVYLQYHMNRVSKRLAR